MKFIQAFLVAITLLCTLTVYGQIGVDNITPDPSSVLDLQSTDKGILIPRMTTAQRQAITAPASSLFVFDTTQGRFYYFNGGQWHALNIWGHTEGDASLSYTGNVGINGVANGSAVLDLTSTEKGLLIPRMTTTQRQAISSPASSLLVFDTDDSRFYFYNGGQWFAVNAWDRIAGTNTITHTGDVTINGTLTATSFGGINVSGVVPTGGIIMWSGSIADIPTGWALCDGVNGTPDLRDRFIVGAGSSYGVGNTGGANSVSLGPLQIPNHTHPIESGGAHTHSYNDRYYIETNTGPMTSASVKETIPSNYNSGVGSAGGADSGNTTWLVYNLPVTGSAGNHPHTMSSSGGGGANGQAHENRPPYYALAYIMKL